MMPKHSAVPQFMDDDGRDERRRAEERVLHMKRRPHQEVVRYIHVIKQVDTARNNFKQNKAAALSTTIHPYLK